MIPQWQKEDGTSKDPAAYLRELGEYTDKLRRLAESDGWQLFEQNLILQEQMATQAIADAKNADESHKAGAQLTTLMRMRAWPRTQMAIAAVTLREVRDAKK